MTRIQYTGSNYDELKALLGDRLLAPYFCMGLTMLSILTDEGRQGLQARKAASAASPFP